jgi:hypothetical protein
MSVIKLTVTGLIFELPGQWAVLLDRGQSSIFLSFALTNLDTGTLILPESLLDDWGNEITGTNLYAWIGENGYRFPRAEVFGFSPTGEARQFFLRELDLSAKYPTYGFHERKSSLESDLLIEHIFLPGGSTSPPQRIRPPKEMERPLRLAQVKWWQVDIKNEPGFVSDLPADFWLMN